MKKILAVFGLIFLISSILYGRIMIDGDGFTYYALARSLSEDHDLDLRNQRLEIPSLHLQINPETRRVASHFSMGFGIFYAPFLVTGDILSRAFPAFQNWKPYIQNNYIPFPHALAIFTGSLMYGFLSLIFSSLTIIRERHSFVIALFCTAAAFVGTPLFFYVFTMPSYAHAVDAFLTSLAFFLAVAARPLMMGRLNFKNILLGFVLASSVALRNNNIVLLPPMILGVLFLEKKKRGCSMLLMLSEIFLGALPFMILLAQFNLSQYGKIISTGYYVQTGEIFLPQMLFYPEAGLFIWTPITVISLAGLIAGSIRRQIESWIAIACILLSLLSIQFQPNWWGGCAFGPRFFTHLFPFWTYGVSESVRVFRKKLIFVAISCFAGWTFFLFHLFFINASSPDFRVLLRQNHCKRTPIDMMDNSLKEYRTAPVLGRSQNPIQFWLNSTERGRFPTVLAILRGRSAQEDQSPEKEEPEK